MAILEHNWFSFFTNRKFEGAFQFDFKGALPNYFRLTLKAKRCLHMNRDPKIMV